VWSGLLQDSNHHHPLAWHQMPSTSTRRYVSTRHLGSFAPATSLQIPACVCVCVEGVCVCHPPPNPPFRPRARYFKGAACSSGHRTTVLRALYPMVNFNNCTENWSDGSESLEEFEARIDGIKR
jgi:hypothetical protein